uniref:Uncharacterized protein n=2 Tax=Setaria TaxID=4554 RepID=K3XQE6_SETIT|nr:hypothetical protein SEVIR_5G151700v2 [Setaria viridis]
MLAMQWCRWGITRWRCSRRDRPRDKVHGKRDRLINKIASIALSLNVPGQIFVSETALIV